MSCFAVPCRNAAPRPQSATEPLNCVSVANARAAEYTASACAAQRPITITITITTTNY